MKIDEDKAKRTLRYLEKSVPQMYEKFSTKEELNKIFKYIREGPNKYKD